MTTQTKEAANANGGISVPTLAPIAYVSKSRTDSQTGQDYTAVEQFAVAELTPELYATATADLGDQWQTRRVEATHLVFYRSWRAYGGSVVSHEYSWRTFETANSYYDALRQIANSRTIWSERNGMRSLVKAVDGCAEMADVLNEMERLRLEGSKAAAAARRTAQKERAAADLEKASNAAFVRMRDGTDSGKELAQKWNSWVNKMRDDSAAIGRFRRDAGLMEAYKEVMAAITVPKKRKAIRLCLEAVAKAGGHGSGCHMP